MNSNWSKISLSFLFVVSIIGTSLRAISYIHLPFEHSHLVHAHSHVAFQGWIYTLMMLLLTHLFLSKDQIKKGKYALQFKLTIFIVLGVLISFSLQGYALYSIIYSTLFQLLNYWFIFKFLKDLSHQPRDTNTAISTHFVTAGLWLALLSTLMPWAIGILAAKGHGDTEIYESCVYAFLHLQYNGWFLFVVLGLFFRCLERDNVVINRKSGITFYWLLLLAVLPAVTLSFLGMSYRNYIMIPAVIAVLLQVVGISLFIKIVLNSIISWLQYKSTWVKIFFTTFILSFILKTVLQCASILPVFEILAFNNKHIVLGYLHLVLLGVLTAFLIGILYHLQWIRATVLNKIGNILFLLGFCITELLLGISGLGIYSNRFLLLLGSSAMALSLLILLLSPNDTRKLGEL